MNCQTGLKNKQTKKHYTITVDPRTKFGLRKGDCFAKRRHFLVFFFGDHEFFSHQSYLFRLLILFPKNSKNQMLEVAKVLKFTFFSIRSLKRLTPAISQIFPVTPIFFKTLTTGTKVGIIPKSEKNPDSRHGRP